MEKHVFFKNKVDGRYGGVVLKAIRAFGPNREEINAMTIDQRLELLQKKAAERGGVWQRVFGKDGRDMEHLRYVDLPFLPDGIFYDCGLERSTFEYPAEHQNVEDECIT